MHNSNEMDPRPTGIDRKRPGLICRPGSRFALIG